MNQVNNTHTKFEKTIGLFKHQVDCYRVGSQTTNAATGSIGVVVAEEIGNTV